MLVVLHALLLSACVVPLQEGQAGGAPRDPAAFRRRGFYLHGCWAFKHPFAVRSWTRADYDHMFQLLKAMDFNTVMLWPVLEAVPPPLSAEDAGAVKAYRPIIDDGRDRKLEVWLTQCAALTSRPEIRARPWMERSLYPFMRTVKIDDGPESAAYLKHRASLVRLLNNADAYVTIDGDPGGYPGAKAAEFARVLKADRETLNAHGERPPSQKIVPWIWAGWGGKDMWREPLEPLVGPVLQELKNSMSEPWEMLPGRSIRENWANGRVNIELTEKAGLMSRSTLLFYEIIEFEPTPPAAVLQFDDIRRVFQQELRFAATARGCFGNAQQPVIVLPNLYLFARIASDPGYLKKTDVEVLNDFADFLGGPADVLVPAWSCLRLGLDRLPAELPATLRQTVLKSDAARHLPGGPKRYVEILAEQVDARRRVLRATAAPAESDAAAAASIVSAVEGLVNWWNTHGYVGQSQENIGFRWDFTHPAVSGPLKEWCRKNVKDGKSVAGQCAAELARKNVLREPEARARLTELLGR
jgi:hypothetical protein